MGGVKSINGGMTVVDLTVSQLNAILGLLYIMEKEDTIESFHENLGVLKTSAQNLFLLLNNILDFNL